MASNNNNSTNNEMNTSMQSRRLNGNYTHGTPESEFSNFECFQNYTAPEVFVQGLAGIVNQGDVELIIRAQKQMLRRFEKTNEMLMNCNVLTASRCKIVTEDLKKHTKLVGDMRKDLDYIFKKVRNIKGRLSARYPEAVGRVNSKSRKSHLSEEGDEALAEQTDDTEKKVSKKKDSASSSKSEHETAGGATATSKYSLENTTVQYVQMQPTPEERTPSNDQAACSSAEVKGPTKAIDESTDNESSDCATDTA